MSEKFYHLPCKNFDQKTRIYYVLRQFQRLHPALRYEVDANYLDIHAVGPDGEIFRPLTTAGMDRATGHTIVPGIGRANDEASLFSSMPLLRRANRP